MPNPPQTSRRPAGKLAKRAKAMSLAHPARATRSGKTPRSIRLDPSSAPADMTLLELLLLLGSFLDDDREVADTAYRMLERGEVRLVGNFRGEPIEVFDTSA